MIAPIFKEMSNTYDDVVFLKVDVDENAETAANYNVSAMPTFVSFFCQLQMNLHLHLFYVNSNYFYIF
jgi:hypothetical protein